MDKFHCQVAFTFWDIGQYVHFNRLLTGFDVIYFEINFTFLIKPFFLYDKKVKTNVQISEERKELLM